MKIFTMQSPLGLLAIEESSEGAVHAISYLGANGKASPVERLEESAVVKQLEEYFLGKREVFDIFLDPNGTDFQNQVWQEIAKIPFGKTISYGDIAKAIGREKAVRAVGAACGKNPVSIVVPCHRVVGKDGSLTGYAGGLERKTWLLEFEGVI